MLGKVNLTALLFRVKVDDCLIKRFDSTLTNLNKFSKKSDSIESEAPFQSSTSLTSKDVVLTQSKEVKILQKLLKIVKYLSVKIEKDKLRN
jgi:hypothetical protein